MMTWPQLQENHFHYLVGFACFVLGCFYFRKELSAAKVLGLFESENSLSLRLVLAAVVVVFTLFMQAAGRLNTLQIEANYTFAGLLLGLGIAKLVGKAFAERAPETKIESKKTTITGENVTNNAAPTREEFNMNES